MAPAAVAAPGAASGLWTGATAAAEEGEAERVEWGEAVELIALLPAPPCRGLVSFVSDSGGGERIIRGLCPTTATGGAAEVLRACAAARGTVVGRVVRVRVWRVGVRELVRGAAGGLCRHRHGVSPQPPLSLLGMRVSAATGDQSVSCIRPLVPRVWCSSSQLLTIESVTLSSKT